jgi:hypothetical protein
MGCPELVLSTVPNFRKYFYTKIQFSTPGSKFSCINLGSKSSGWPNVPVLLNRSNSLDSAGPGRKLVLCVQLLSCVYISSVHVPVPVHGSVQQCVHLLSTASQQLCVCTLFTQYCGLDQLR